MARCQTCRKGLLRRDRERGRCGRCGLFLTLPPPKYISKEYRERLARGGGPPVPPSVFEYLKVCPMCEEGDHEECDDQIRWFCLCWRTNHDPEETMRDMQKILDIVNAKKKPEEEEEWEEFG